MYYQPYYSQPQQHQPPPQHQPQQHQPQQQQPQPHQPQPHQPQPHQPQPHQPQPHQSPPHQSQPHHPPHQPQPHHPPHLHQQPQPPLHSSREPHHTYRPAYSSFYRPAPAQNRSSHNLNFSREFERFPTPPHGYSSMPSGAYPFYDATNQQHQQQQQQQQRWRPSTTRVQNQYRRTPAFHFQDKSTYYYMSDPIITNDNRITIQLTKVHVGHNGDQQRVFVEQEFSDESELKKFVKNLRHNFEKTFNNRATGAHSSSENIDQNQSPNSKKSGVIVVEEPDEEPKIYEQQAYNENIESKQSRNNKSPITSSPGFDDCEHCQRSPVDSSCSTARTKGRRRHKTKHHREKFDTELHIEEKEQPTEKIPSYSHQYEPPPRFQQQQQRTFPREKDFRMRNDFSVPPNLNSHWRYNGYSHSLNSRSRSYIPAMNENYPPATPSRFQYTKEPFFRPIHPPTPSRFTHSKNQHKSQPSPRFYHTSHPRRNQPRTIADHFTFMNNEHQQTRVHRTRSECRPQVPIRSRSKTYLYLEYGNNLNQRHYTPYAQSSAPMFYTQRRFFRNPQKHSCLFNSYRPNSKRF